MELDVVLTGLAVASALVAIFTCAAFVPAFRGWPMTNRARPSLASDTYSDADGAATAESAAAFSNAAARWALLTAASAGATTSLASVITATRAGTPPSVLAWTQFAIWLLLIAQASVIFATPQPTRQYTLAGWSSLASLAIGIRISAQLILQRALWSKPADASLLVLTLVSAVAASIAGIAFPRRPDVYYDGREVDRCATVSLWSKWTFAWPFPALRYASKHHNLELSDLATIDHTLRADPLRSQFEASDHSAPLWRRILSLHKWNYVSLLAVQVFSSIFEFVPQFVLFWLLRLLEARDNGAGDQFSLYVAALGMGLAVACYDWLRSVLVFIYRIRLEIPILVQLAVGLFSKSVRGKNVIGVAETEEGSAADDASDSAESNATDTPSKTKQNVINLVSIDADRIADVSSAVHVFLEAVSLIGISVVFLVTLLGWIPLLSGLVVPLLLSPFNLYISRKWMTAEDELMSARDRKMASVNEALQGIRQIKFSALEDVWAMKIFEARKIELIWQWQLFTLDLWLTSIWEFGPVFLAATSLTVYSFMHGSLSASVAFTSISVFHSLESGLEVTPVLVSLVMDFIVSARRIEIHLGSPEQVANEKHDGKIVFENAVVSWPCNEKRDQDFLLRDVSLSFETGELNVISGKTGSGKSLLLCAIIGEADVRSGKVCVPAAPCDPTSADRQLNGDSWILPSSMAYVGQSPWIENASFRENILFHLPYDKDRYKQVLHACALEPDLELLTDGDQTEIGVNGVNLSGGQKWRVSLARALYSRASILVMDDVFSAVDAHVSRHLYEHALTGPLGRNRTRVLVTHHVELCLPSTHYSVLLEDGRVIRAGPTSELRQDGSILTLLERSRTAQDEPDSTADKPDPPITKLRRTSTAGSEGMKRLARQDSRASATARAPEKFTTSESREFGSVKLAIYKEYIRACRGFGFWSIVLAAFVAFALAGLARSYWVTLWTRASEGDVDKSGSFQTGAPKQMISEQYAYAAIYVGISLVEGTMGLVRYLILYYGSIHGSKRLFEAMTRRILQTPLRFLDTTPVGRLNNRFSADFVQVDKNLAVELASAVSNVISIIAVVAAAMFVSPYMVGFLVVFGIVVRLFAVLYIHAAREVNRLANVTRSPIFEQYGSVLTGLATIRAFGMIDKYIDRMHRLMNDHTVANLQLSMFNRWVDLRLNMIGAAFTFVTALVIVGIRSIDASLAGFALSFSLQLSGDIIRLIKGYTDVEMAFNAVERVLDYMGLDIESDEGDMPPAAWPARGEVEVEDLTVAYAEGLPPILHRLNFVIRPHARVGVVGRTGAGKSSLTLALLRLIDTRSGLIRIDGIDISTIKVEALRSRLTMIPQNPVLFSGTIRSNLDPDHQRTDAELLDALFRVRLLSSTAEDSASSDVPSTKDDQPASQTKFTLATAVAEGGANFSHGQKQLLCLARAIVTRPKLLILDEATSAVDMETDAQIQKTLRHEFHNSTLLVIAHRLTTIADFDRILVLGEGKVVEYGSPSDLMQSRSPTGFYGLVMESGERNAIEETIRRQQEEGSD